MWRFQRWQIISSFPFSRSQDGGEISYLHLETRQKLDREHKANYPIQIAAITDSGAKGLLSLNVEILDVNDNPPVFEETEYRVLINDSVSPGTQIVQTVAVDADEGKNAKVVYSMPDEFESHFQLDATTGWLK